MQFKDNSLDGILQSLAADEFLAWMQYYLGKIIAQGKALNHLNKLFDDTAKDELDDHYNKLVIWMQSKGIQVITDLDKMQKISNHPYFPFSDGTDSKTLVAAQIVAEEDAIDAYTTAMTMEVVKSYPDLVVILGEICNDEREHLKELNDINSTILSRDPGLTPEISDKPAPSSINNFSERLMKLFSIDDDYDSFTFPSPDGINKTAFYVLTKRNEKAKFVMYRRTFPDSETANKFADEYESKNKDAECRVLDGHKVASLASKFKNFAKN